MLDDLIITIFHTLTYFLTISQDTAVISGL